MRNRIWWLIALGAALMGAGMLAAGHVYGSACGLADARDQIGVTAKAGATGNGTFTLDDIEAIAANSGMKGSTLCWWAEGTGSIGTSTRSTQADVYAVSGSFQDFHPIRMLYGSFLPRTGTGQACVLADDLAFRIFGTVNVVGLEVQYQGKTFQVCGVCKADTSVLGLMSGNGMFRAYVTGGDLISSGKLTIGGFEALMPRAAPGTSLAAVKTAMQAQGKPSGSFLVTDEGESIRMGAEAARLPFLLLWLSAVIVLIGLCWRSMLGVMRQSVSVLGSDYFRNTCGRLALGIGKLLLLAAVSAALCAGMLQLIGVRFLLPSRYIPDSWIDPTFYKSLLQSESQAAIAARAYPQYWWNTAQDAAGRLSLWLNAAAVLGFLVAVFSVRVLAAERKAQPAQPTAWLWDATWLMALAIAAFGLTVLLSSAFGLPLFADLSSLAALALGLIAWAAALHGKEIEAALYKPVEKSPQQEFLSEVNK